MLLGVKTDEAVKSRIKSIAASIKHYADRKEILIDNLNFSATSVSFEVLDSDDVSSFQLYKMVLNL